MRRAMLQTTLLFLGGLTLLQPAPEARQKMNLAPFGQLFFWEGDEARELAGPSEAAASIEDPVDDIDQGRWLRAETQEECQGSECRYTFQPLRVEENRLAANLPGLVYRRTLKVRLVSGNPLPRITAIQAFSDSLEKPVSIRITAGNGGATEQAAHFRIATEPGVERKAEGRQLRVIGGALRAVVGAPSPLAAEPLPGSDGQMMAGRLPFAVPPGASRSCVVKLAFVSDLTPAESLDLERIVYEAERLRSYRERQTLPPLRRPARDHQTAARCVQGAN